MQSSSESATLPRGFRFHYRDGQRPKTPESYAPAEIQPPSPPRAGRLKIKRRNVSQFTAPTEHFLASVAAADVAIPTIEIAQDQDLAEGFSNQHVNAGFLSARTFEDRLSPPKTPVPQLAQSILESDRQRPDWYMDETSNQADMSRPSSALSNPSDWSDDSFFSCSQLSRPSDDGSCSSPESEGTDPFRSYTLSKGKGRERLAIIEISPDQHLNLLNSQMRSKTSKDRRWARDMSEHLWRTYQIYLQDPTVTPFRIGASAVPPEGVIHRVARQAKRSWKGARQPDGQRVTSPHSTLGVESSMGTINLTGSPDPAVSVKSGSLTPTGEKPLKGYLQWPHSSAATRKHLRELCKNKDSTSVQTHRHLQSRSPTPFSQTHPRAGHRLRTPAPTRPSSFSTKDMALSLTTSSVESMQPDGPLATLTASTDSTNSSVTNAIQDELKPFGLGISLVKDERPRRLGSPFSARTYGPSSSKSLQPFSRPSLPQNPQDSMSSTVNFLRSPLRFDQARSLNGTQKRRAQHSLEEELSPSGGVLRPSILDEQLFGGPLELHQRRVRRSRGFSLGDEALGSCVPGLFAAQATATTRSSNLESNTSVADADTSSTLTTPSLLPAAVLDPPRLGSPFLESGASNTFPRRFALPVDGTSTVRRRPFATMHHSRRSIESFDFGTGPSLQSRLSQLDQKLAEIRDREAAGRSRSRD